MTLPLPSRRSLSLPGFRYGVHGSHLGVSV